MGDADIFCFNSSEIILTTFNQCNILILPLNCTNLTLHVNYNLQSTSYTSVLLLFLISEVSHNNIMEKSV